MARYIDAERLKWTFASGIRVYDGMCRTDDIFHSIDNEPTADVVEVVRCKDCKHWSCHGKGRIVDENVGMCYNSTFPFYCEDRPITLETAFCSYGERKEKEILL